MALNDPDVIYGSEAQREFARRMAEALLKGKGGVQGLPADVATIPYAGLNYGVANIINSIQGAQYRDIAGSQDKASQERKIPGNEGYMPDVTRGLGVPRTQRQRLASLPGASAPIPGAVPSIVEPSGPTPSAPLPPSGAVPAAPAPSITTGSIDSVVNDDYVNKLIKIESRGDPNAVSPSGRHKGLGQFSDALEKKYGIYDNNRTDPIVQSNAIKEHAKDNYKAFEAVMGRPPTHNELYMMHQQGTTGGMNLAKRPDEPAWKVLRPFKGSDWLAKKSIMDNIPANHPVRRKGVDRITSNDLMGIYREKFEGGGNIKTASLGPMSPTEAITKPAQAAGPSLIGGQPGTEGFATAALPRSFAPPTDSIVPSGPGIPQRAAVPNAPVPSEAGGITPVQPGGNTTMPKTSDILPQLRPTLPIEPMPSPRGTEAFIPPNMANIPGAPPMPPEASINSPQAPTQQLPPVAPIPSPGSLNVDELSRKNTQLEDMLNNIPGVPPSSLPNNSQARPPGMMNLGMGKNLPPDAMQAGAPTPPGEVSGAPPVQLAQGKPWQAEIAKPAAPSIIEIPGYKGPAPPVMPAWTDAMLRARLEAAPIGEHDKILEVYHNSLRPQGYEVPGGRLMAIPKRDGPTEFMFLPHGEPTEPGKVVPDASKMGPGNRLIVPGSGDKDRLGSSPEVPGQTDFERLKRDQQKIESEGGATNLRMQSLEKQRTEIVEGIQNSISQQRGLGAMQALSKTLDLTRSPTKDIVLKAKSIADQFLPKGAADLLFDKTDLSASELYEKLNLSMAMADTRGITSRGTNFDIMTTIRGNPGLLQSKAGTELLADTLRQNHKVENILARKLNKVPTHELHKLPDIIEQVYKENPLILNLPNKPPIYIRPMERDEETNNWVKSLPKGAQYVDDRGEVRTRP